MSGGISPVSARLIVYDSGVVGGGAAFDSGVIDPSRYILITWAFLNQSLLTARSLAYYYLRTDGVEALSSNTALPVNIITTGSGGTYYAGVRFRVAAAGSDNARLVCFANPR